MVTKKELADLQEKVSKQEETIKSLITKVKKLEGDVIQINAERAIASHINIFLRQSVDNLQQYTRRSCLLLEGLPSKPNESVKDVEKSVKDVLETKLGFEKNTVDFEFDKAHRVSSKSKKVIIRFRSHSFQNQVYSERNNCTDPKLKFRPSLTTRRGELLENARDILSVSPNFRFAFADSNGKLKVRFKEKVYNKIVINFNDENDIAHIAAVIDDHSIDLDEHYHTDNLFPMSSEY